MNILYVGHYRESSGWGEVARNNILALDRVGVNVVPRAIKLGLANFDLPPRIKELENKTSEGCNIIIQHILPHYMQYDNAFKNIGMFELETTNIEHHVWTEYLNLMDELWVPCSDMMHMGGINRPIKLVPHTCDISEYKKEYPPLNIPILKDKFVFYFIGDLTVRKHLGALLRAFHTEFDNEPVELVLKISKHGVDPSQLAKEVVGFCDKIKENLRLYQDIKQYKSPVIITLHLSRQDLLSLHQECDCFVCPSYGEAWCLPAFEAMAMGNIVIASNAGGPKDYIKHGHNGYLVNGSMEPVFGQHETLEGFGTAREKWFDISVSDLQKNMRTAYEENNGVRKYAAKSAYDYDYDIIGNKMKELLNV